MYEKEPTRDSLNILYITRSLMCCMQNLRIKTFVTALCGGGVFQVGKTKRASSQYNQQAYD